jgi:hypothetical protein
MLLKNMILLGIVCLSRPHPDKILYGNERDGGHIASA